HTRLQGDWSSDVCSSDLMRRAGRRLSECGVGTGVYLQAIARALSPLENRDARAAFLHTLRAVIDVHGQRVSATDRLYLLESMPRSEERRVGKECSVRGGT